MSHAKRLQKLRQQRAGGCDECRNTAQIVRRSAVELPGEFAKPAPKRCDKCGSVLKYFEWLEGAVQQWPRGVRIESLVQALQDWKRRRLDAEEKATVKFTPAPHCQRERQRRAMIRQAV